MLVTAIPDIEPLRIEMNLCFAELRGELDRRFAGIERATPRADLFVGLMARSMA